MFFNKKHKKEEVCCPKCKSGITEEYSFCPLCGNHLVNPEKELKQFGILGRHDIADEEIINRAVTSHMTVTERLLGSLMNSLLKNLDMQVRDADAPEIRATPNGIRIRVGAPTQQRKREAKIVNRSLTERQITRMNNLPRTEAKTNIRRLADKVVYELSALGIQSPDDVFVSKTESGYEIKAIGKNKVYINSV